MTTPPQQDKGVQSPFTGIMTFKSPEAARQFRQAFVGVSDRLKKNIEDVGTVHFLRLLLLENDAKLALITTFDGDLDRYIEDFLDKLGPEFDLIFHFIQDAPPSPVQAHREEFRAFIDRITVESLDFYSGYPDLTVQRIRHLARRDTPGA